MKNPRYTLHSFYFGLIGPFPLQLICHQIGYLLEYVHHRDRRKTRRVWSKNLFFKLFLFKRILKYYKNLNKPLNNPKHLKITKKIYENHPNKKYKRNSIYFFKHVYRKTTTIEISSSNGAR